MFGVALAALLFGCATRDRDARLAQRIDALISPLVAANAFSGAVVLTRGEAVVYQRGFGMANRADGLAFTPDTPTDGGSLAKTFTAAALWWLATEGTVDLDAPVTRYLPQFPHASTTVRQLISHSNGLPPYYEFFDSHFAADELRTTDALLRVVRQHAPTPAFAPGSRYEYSNLGFDAAARVIEQTAGKPYGQVLHERFFQRLGMRSSFARPARLADWKGVRTLGYRWRDNAWQVVDVYDMEAFVGASNLYFSAADLARWGSAHARGAALPAEVFAAGQQRPRIGDRASPVTGLSWYCSDSGTRCHYTGSINAFHSLVYWDRRREESVVMVSNGSVPPWKTISLQRALVAALAGKSAEIETPPAFERIARRGRAALAGTYRADGIGDIVVTVDDTNRLGLRIDDGLEFGVFQLDAEVFYVPGLDYWIGFSGGAPPARLHVRSMYVDTVAARR